MTEKQAECPDQQNLKLENKTCNCNNGTPEPNIVKRMLLSSRSGTTVKEPNEINALADEYLGLAFHGLRAKDRSFKAEMKTDFDESGGKIDILPQDIGRVLLNLFNNAFYATGLRLSLTYDSEGAWGEIKVERKVDEGNPDNFGKGKGTEFII